MRIRHFSFVGVRGLDGLKRDLPRTSDADLTVVFGAYASGKTAFLDTIAAAKEKIAPYGATDPRWDSLVAVGSAAKVLIDWEAGDEERARFGLSDPLLSSEAVLGKAEGVVRNAVAVQGILADPGAARRGSVHYLHDTRDLEGPVSFGAEDAGVRLRLTTRNAKFSEIYDVLDHPERLAEKELASQRLAELCPGLAIEGLRRFGTSFASLVRDRKTGAVRRVDSLSTSERQSFLLALWASRAPIVDSVVLVDAPELGFGDGAVEYVRAILRWTSHTQVIVATSAAAVRSMPEVANVVELPS